MFIGSGRFYLYIRDRAIIDDESEIKFDSRIIPRCTYTISDYDNRCVHMFL